MPEDEVDTSADLSIERCTISIIVPVYNTPVQLLELCITSVLTQTYPDWELILVDDGSRSNDLATYLGQVGPRDARIRIIRRSDNGGISTATNDGVAQARGEFLAFLDHDDELMADALAVFADVILAAPDVDLIYSDQIKINEKGRQIDHFYKPDWSPTYFLGVMYVGHLMAVRSSICHAVGGFLSEYDGVQDYEFVLRASTKARKIVHVPRPLYKWRAISGSIAAASNAKKDISKLHAQAAQRHATQRGLDWQIEPHPGIPHRTCITPSERSPTPSISIVIPTRDQGRLLSTCLNSIYSLTDYPAFEVVLVDNDTREPLALAAMQQWPSKRVKLEGQFNFSRACNLGAEAGSGEYLLFMNNDTEVLEKGWLRTMAAYTSDKDVGMIGPLLIYPEGRVQHAGVVLGARGTADHVMRNFPSDVDGYAGSLSCAREVSAVTAACALIPRELFNGVGGFSTDYAKHYQDVDLCLKVRTLGFRILSIPRPRLIHHESVSRKADGYDMGDRAILMDRWQTELARCDPYYNQHLNLEKLDYSTT